MDINLKTSLAEDKMDLLNKFIETKIRESFLKFYTGKIIDNNDPEKLGRCKIRVFGIFHDEIPDIDLPWAVPDFNFIGSKIGSFVVPPLDAIVRVYFDDGDIYKPKYTTKIIDTNNLSSEKDDDYPYTMVLWETDEGEYLKINRKTYETTYHSASGALFTIAANGSVTVDTAETDAGDIILQDKHGNKLEMTSDGVKINNQYIVTQKFLESLLIGGANNLSFCIGNVGAPAPVSPTTVSDIQAKTVAPDLYLTNKSGVI